MSGIVIRDFQPGDYDDWPAFRAGIARTADAPAVRLHTTDHGGGVAAVRVPRLRARARRGADPSGPYARYVLVGPDHCVMP